MPTSNRNTTTDYLNLTISEAVARIADLEHDYAVTRLMLSETLTIAATAKRDAARERQQRFALAEEFREFRRCTMAESLRPSRSEKPSEAHYRQSTVTPPPVTADFRSEKPRPHA
jgi:hypothetical protein